MRHNPGFFTFYSAYLNENARFDLQNAFLEEEKQDQLFRMFAHVSLTRDPRATRDMVPPEVWAQVAPDPAILALEEERDRLKKGSYRIAGHENEQDIRELTDEIRTRKAERDKRIVTQWREYYFYNRPTWDVEAQIRGEVQETYEEPAIDLAIPERHQLAELLCYQPKDLTDKELTRRRNQVIDLMVALCDKRETGRVNEFHPRPVLQRAVKKESPEPILAEPRDEPDPFPLLMDANQCPDCIGDERLPLAERAFRWCRPTVRNDHFDDDHLAGREAAEKNGDNIKCNHSKCRKKSFEHLDHFRRHVQDVHGVKLRTSLQVTERRRRKEERRRMSRKKRN